MALVLTPDTILVTVMDMLRDITIRAKSGLRSLKETGMMSTIHADIALVDNKGFPTV